MWFGQQNTRKAGTRRIAPPIAAPEAPQAPNRGNWTPAGTLSVSRSLPFPQTNLAQLRSLGERESERDPARVRGKGGEKTGESIAWVGTTGHGKKSKKSRSTTARREPGLSHPKSTRARRYKIRALPPLLSPSSTRSAFSSSASGFIGPSSQRPCPSPQAGVSQSQAWQMWAKCSTSPPSTPKKVSSLDALLCLVSFRYLLRKS